MRRVPSAGGGGSGDAGFVRADQIDLKSLDEQLERHLGRPERGGPAAAQPGSRGGESARLGEESQLLLQQQQHKRREDWEIDPSKLVIKGVIARGTFGTVHRGVYDGQDVAVKLLDWGEDGHRSEQEIAALRAAFSQEVSVWYKLDHPNVTKFIGAIMGARDLNIQTEHGHLGMPSNICCVVVEYLAGGALKNFLIKNRRRKLAFKVVVQLALDLARGLSYLHSKKIVHRDVKTENMLLDKTRTVKIADFGVARIEASNPSDMTGETGTLGYMAPETTKRKGWINHSIKGPESIADHMYRMALMALIAGDLPAVDRERCIKIAIVHDIAEAIVGDITPSDGIPKAEKSRREQKALNEMCEVLGGGPIADEIKELWEEYENNSSIEANIVKDFDKVEMILQALEYEKEHGKVLDEFFISTAGKFQTEIGKSWAAEVNARRNKRCGKQK